MTKEKTLTCCFLSAPPVWRPACSTPPSASWSGNSGNSAARPTLQLQAIVGKLSVSMRLTMVGDHMCTLSSCQGSWPHRDTEKGSSNISLQLDTFYSSARNAHAEVQTLSKSKSLPRRCVITGRRHHPPPLLSNNRDMFKGSRTNDSWFSNSGFNINNCWEHLE